MSANARTAAARFHNTCTIWGVQQITRHDYRTNKLFALSASFLFSMKRWSEGSHNLHNTITEAIIPVNVSCESNYTWSHRRGKCEAVNRLDMPSRKIKSHVALIQASMISYDASVSFRLVFLPTDILFEENLKVQKRFQLVLHFDKFKRSLMTNLFSTHG